MGNKNKSNLRISNIRIRVVENKKYIKAYCSVVINNSFFINGIQLIRTNDGYFINMPSKTTKLRLLCSNGTYSK